jgi:hypothetical protein
VISSNNVGASRIMLFTLCHDLQDPNGRGKNSILQTSVCTEECRLLGCGALWVYYESDVSEEHIASIFRVEEMA